MPGTGDRRSSERCSRKVDSLGLVWQLCDDQGPTLLPPCSSVVLNTGFCFTIHCGCLSSSHHSHREQEIKGPSFKKVSGSWPLSLPLASHRPGLVRVVA